MGDRRMSTREDREWDELQDRIADDQEAREAAEADGDEDWRESALTDGERNR